MTDTDYMHLALEEAQTAFRENEIPIGAVLVCHDMVIAKGHNRREATTDPTSHAEIEVIREASQFLSRWRLTDCVLYVTIEPCPMCAGAIMNARVGKVVYGSPNPLYGGIDSKFHIGASGVLNHTLEIKSGICQKKCQALMDDFFLTHRDGLPK